MNKYNKIINKILNEEVHKLLTESFNSKIIQQLANKHGGVDLNSQSLLNMRHNGSKDMPMYVKYVLSEITDEMFDEEYDSKEDYAKETGNSLDYLYDNKIFWIPFKDGTLATLKKPSTIEGAKLYQQLFGNNGKMWNNAWNANHKKDTSFYDDNYIPQGSRGMDYHDIMSHAKMNNNRIADFDKDKKQSAYNYGSNLDRYYDNARMNSTRKSLSNKNGIEKDIQKRRKKYY